MATSKADGKRRLLYQKMEDDQEEEEEDEDVGRELGFGEDCKKKKTKAIVCSSKRGSTNGGGGSAPPCQADDCSADLTGSKRYHRRHKVCELHAKAPVAVVAGLRQRFCQQCSRFHGLVEFDETKRSCRKRLAGHNQRRRKSSNDIHGESST